MNDLERAARIADYVADAAEARVNKGVSSLNEIAELVTIKTAMVIATAIRALPRAGWRDGVPSAAVIAAHAEARPADYPAHDHCYDTGEVVKHGGGLWMAREAAGHHPELIRIRVRGGVREVRWDDDGWESLLAQHFEAFMPLQADGVPAVWPEEP